MNLNLENLKKMFSAATAEISARENELSALDAVCGDGDHGSSVKGAMRAANDAVSKASNLKDAFFDAGFAAMSHSNGSTSTLFGSFFMGISDGIKAGAQELGGEELGTAFESGLSSLRSNTKADVGDKTLMDALVPAVAAMRGSKSVESAFSAAAEAAEKECLAAKFGRAKNLGEKSVGSLDAGAVSMSIIFREFEKALKE